MKKILITIAVTLSLLSCSKESDELKNLIYLDLGQVEVQRIHSDFEEFDAIAFKVETNRIQPFDKAISKVFINSVEPVGFNELTINGVTTVEAYDYKYEFQTGDYARIELYLFKEYVIIEP